jgi:protein arginine kinase activator
MKLHKCFFCNKLAATPFHVTEIDGDKVQSVDLCVNCAAEYMAALEPTDSVIASTPQQKAVNLTHITTPEELLELLTGVEPKFEKKYPVHEPCKCGMTLQEFDEYGRFGCPHCYDHFEDLIEHVVLPYHNNPEEHVGKRPKYLAERQADKDPKEKMKLLKLRLAQAIELEEYERAAVLKQEIDALTQSFPSTSEDQ